MLLFRRIPWQGERGGSRPRNDHVVWSSCPAQTARPSRGPSWTPWHQQWRTRCPENGPCPGRMWKETALRVKTFLMLSTTSSRNPFTNLDRTFSIFWGYQRCSWLLQLAIHVHLSQNSIFIELKNRSNKVYTFLHAILLHAKTYVLSKSIFLFTFSLATTDVVRLLIYPLTISDVNHEMTHGESEIEDSLDELLVLSGP